MISKSELLKIAKFKALPPRLAELDYLQDIALFNLSREFGNTLIFKGGTCLYKAFQLNRFSEDLDFSATYKFREKDFFKRLPYFFTLLDMNAAVRINRFENTVNIQLFVNGPLYDGSKDSQARVLLNISSRERVLLGVQCFSYKPLYQELRTFDLYVMDEREILAEKIRAIYERKKARDVFDLWYLLNVRKTPVENVITNKKLARLGFKFEKSSLLRKIEEKQSSWRIDLGSLVSGEVPPFAGVVRDIMEAIQ